VNSGPRPCLVDVGFPLSGPRDRTSTSDLKRHAQHTARDADLRPDHSPATTRTVPLTTISPTSMPGEPEFTGSESVSGGEGNWARTALSAVSGGQANWAVGFSSSISGGVANETDNVWGSVLGGSHRVLPSSAAQAASEAGPTVFAP
jgi:hypothetical protein